MLRGPMNAFLSFHVILPSICRKAPSLNGVLQARRMKAICYQGNANYVLRIWEVTGSNLVPKKSVIFP